MKTKWDARRIAALDARLSAMTPYQRAVVWQKARRTLDALVIKRSTKQLGDCQLIKPARWQRNQKAPQLTRFFLRI